MIHITGSSSKDEIPRVGEQLEQAYKKGETEVIVDLTICTYMDSFALGLLIYYHTLLAKDRRKLVLLLTKDYKLYPNRLLELTNLDKVFNVVFMEEPQKSAS